MRNYEKVENMTTTNLLSLLGGLALFLYGMQMMGNGLEAAAGDRLKQILEKLTSNRFLGVLVGALVTAVIQSSSATTVMVVGFVNAQMMTLQQAVWIIMGVYEKCKDNRYWTDYRRFGYLIYWYEYDEYGYDAIKRIQRIR